MPQTVYGFTSDGKQSVEYHQLANWQKLEALYLGLCLQECFTHVYTPVHLDRHPILMTIVYYCLHLKWQPLYNLADSSNPASHCSERLYIFHCQIIMKSVLVLLLLLTVTISMVMGAALPPLPGLQHHSRNRKQIHKQLLRAMDEQDAKAQIFGHGSDYYYYEEEQPEPTEPPPPPKRIIVFHNWGHTLTRG